MIAIYQWDEASQTWLGFFPGTQSAPGLNTLTVLRQGGTYWVATTEPVTWTVTLPSQQPTVTAASSATAP